MDFHSIYDRMTVVNPFIGGFNVKTKKNLALFALTLGATAALAAVADQKLISHKHLLKQRWSSRDNFKAVNGI